MSLSVAVVAASIWLIVCTFSLVQANVRFHFTLDFHVKQPSNGGDETINKTILVENNQISVIDNEPTTMSPIGQWTDQEQYNEATLQKVVEARRAVQQLNAELAPLVGRSNDLAIRLKQSLRYVNEVDATLEDLSNFGQLVELLRKFVTLVDALKEPTNYGGVRSLEYVLLKLALERYELNNKRQEINEYLQRAENAWTSYKSTQVVLLENSSNST